MGTIAGPSENGRLGRADAVPVWACTLAGHYLHHAQTAWARGVSGCLWAGRFSPSADGPLRRIGWGPRKPAPPQPPEQAGATANSSSKSGHGAPTFGRCRGWPEVVPAKGDPQWSTSGRARWATFEGRPRSSGASVWLVGPPLRTQPRLARAQMDVGRTQPDVTTSWPDPDPTWPNQANSGRTPPKIGRTIMHSRADSAGSDVQC